MRFSINQKWKVQNAQNGVYDFQTLKNSESETHDVDYQL